MPKMEDSITGMIVLDFLEGVKSGEYDKYLEAVLAECHDRKRAKRGTAGFPRNP